MQTHKPGPCLWCGQYVWSQREAAGAPPETAAWDACWGTEDGDFGCFSSPETTDEGVGDHARPSDLVNLYHLVSGTAHIVRRVRQVLWDSRDEEYLETGDALDVMSDLVKLWTLPPAERME